MSDIAHEFTDREIEKLEKQIQSVYLEAQRDIEKKLDTFIKKFRVKADIKYREMIDGKITKDEYKRWVSGQVFQMDQWKAKRDQITNVIHNSNKTAINIINGKMNGVFAENATYMNYSLEHEAGVNFGFGVYDNATVVKLIKDDPQLLPKWKINEKKDYIWNQQKVNNAVIQGIIQGEKLDQISKRIFNGLAMQNKNLSKTFARTAMTEAQNAGRVESLRNAKKLGIDVEKEWMATLDRHTRDSHARIDGESIPENERFSNGLRYPGDPEGNAQEIYNCRCTLVGNLKKYPAEYERYDNIEGTPIKNMTYTEWKEAKSKFITQTNFGDLRDKLGDDFVNTMETMLNFTEYTDVKDVFYKFQDQLHIIDSNASSGAYYSPTEQGIHMNAQKIQQGDNAHNPYQTAFHEFAHNIDHVAGNGRWYTRDYSDGVLNNTIKSDFNDFVTNTLRKNRNFIVEDDHDMGRILRRMSTDEDDYFKVLSHKLRNGEITMDKIWDKHSDDIIKYFLSDPVNKSSAHWYVIDTLKAEELSLSATASISDMIEFCTGKSYPLGVGHGTKYWGEHVLLNNGDEMFMDHKNAPLEFFAEVCDGMIANPESLNQMRRVFPNAVNVVEKILKELVK